MQLRASEITKFHFFFWNKMEDEKPKRRSHALVLKEKIIDLQYVEEKKKAALEKKKKKCKEDFEKKKARELKRLKKAKEAERIAEKGVKAVFKGELVCATGTRKARAEIAKRNDKIEKLIEERNKLEAGIKTEKKKRSKY